MARASTQDVINALQVRGLTMNPGTYSGDWIISGDRQASDYRETPRRFVVTVSNHRILRVREGIDSIGQFIDMILRAAVRADDIRRGQEELERERTADRSRYGLPGSAYGLPPQGLRYTEDPDCPDDAVYGFNSETLHFNGQTWPAETTPDTVKYYDPITGRERRPGEQQSGDLCYDTATCSAAHINRRVREAVEANHRLAAIQAQKEALREITKPIERKTRKIRI